MTRYIYCMTPVSWACAGHDVPIHHNPNNVVMNDCSGLKSALSTFLNTDFGVFTPYNMDSTACQRITSRGGPQFPLRALGEPRTLYFRFKCGFTEPPTVATTKAPTLPPSVIWDGNILNFAHVCSFRQAMRKNLRQKMCGLAKPAQLPWASDLYDSIEINGARSYI